MLPPNHWTVVFASMICPFITTHCTANRIATSNPRPTVVDSLRFRSLQISAYVQPKAQDRCWCFLMLKYLQKFLILKIQL